jgi:hypothetical protein
MEAMPTEAKLSEGEYARTIQHRQTDGERRDAYDPDADTCFQILST